MATTTTGTGTAPGTCGEIVQGQFRAGENFLVTFPIDLWSTVTIEFDSQLPGIACTPPEKTKSCRAVHLLLKHLNLRESGAILTFSSDIPIGKGMASSTADITAACRAVGAALDVAVSPELISEIAAQIEPSDGNMYPGVVVYDHLNCRLIETLGPSPPADLLVVDLGDTVDTVAYNQLPKTYSQSDFAAFQDAYHKVKAGIQFEDLAQLGAAATASARLNQKLLFKPELENLIALAEAHQAHGVCIGHSGTIAALIFNPNSPQLPQAQAAIAASLPEAETFLTHSLTTQRNRTRES